MLLILKDKKQSANGTEKTVKILKKKLEKLGTPAEIYSFEEVKLFIEKNNVRAFVGKKSILRYSTVYFRRVGEKRNLAFILSHICKKNNITFIDKLYQATNEPSKLKQTAFLALNNLLVPKTYFSSNYNQTSIKNAEKFLGFPMVIKISKSKKGEGVFLAQDKKEALSIVKNYPEGEILIQEFIPNNYDYRILVLDNSIGCVIKRERTDKKKEFRNNVCLGATEKFLNISTVSTTLKKDAILAAKKSDIQVAGVDIVVSPDNRNYVLEVNRSPAFTFDEKVSNELDSLANYLFLCNLKERKK
jgi:glutathione synthase/RimK-type ligase-like ATP-grasp enzyme